MVSEITAEQNRNVAIRDACSIVAIRDRASDCPKVLMGQRGARAAFMANKFVFPGGAVDAQDRDIPLLRALPDTCRARLEEDSNGPDADTLCIAAIRELQEETGLFLGSPGDWLSPVPEGWQDFAARGLRPDAAALTFFFRAITPPGRPRRFDARFFFVDADALSGDLDRVGEVTDELGALQWIPLSEVRGFDLPFITQVVLAEVAGFLRSGLSQPASVPFFRNDDEESLFLRLNGARPGPND